MSITAIIPVREGSRRMKNKNILPFADSNLLIHKIRQLKQVPEIETIIVSSDSNTMLQMAKDEGVETHEREEKYCDEISEPFSEVVRNICEHVPGEHILWSPCVSPLVEPKHYSDAIKTYLNNAEYDSLVSVRKFKEYLWDKSGSVNYDAGQGHVPSQDLPDMWLVTNGFFLAKRVDMIRWGYLLGKKVYKYEVDKRSSIDIDDDIDYEIDKALACYTGGSLKQQQSHGKRNTVVIGATGNLGSVVARSLTEDGFTVDPTWLSANHPDATKPESYANLPDKIHCAVYVAGINIVQETTKLTKDEWDKVLATNLTGAFLFAQAAYSALAKVPGSTFIVISSIMATHPYAGRLAYSASKAGLEGLARSLAVEWGPSKIFTHAIRLGHLSTIMSSSSMDPRLLDMVKQNTPAGDLIEPTAVADYIVWLANGGSRYVTGSVIDFDAGYTMHRNLTVS